MTTKMGDAFLQRPCAPGAAGDENPPFPIGRNPADLRFGPGYSR
jgi:hypothetical protein